jgi:hypothetical protein
MKKPNITQLKKTKKDNTTLVQTNSLERSEKKIKLLPGTVVISPLQILQLYKGITRATSKATSNNFYTRHYSAGRMI